MAIISGPGPGQYLGDVCPDLRIYSAILMPIWSPFVIVSLLTSLFLYTAKLLTAFEWIAGQSPTQYSILNG